ncbi:MAG TPA: GGDEF domain-containing protein [Armatimonadota bacterium]|nr:GGDEF domain-containing protein [Armatimonadota bacterium]
MEEDRYDIHSVIRNKDITTHFQPIVDLRNAEILGYEALSRGPENTELRSPVNLIEKAEAENCLWDLEVLFREVALATAKSLELKSLLFLNVDPNIVNDPTFISGFTKQYIREHGLLPEMIVFEITERSAIDDFKNFRLAMRHYQEQGYKTAIDDTGAGYSNFSVISKIKPHFIKIDMELIRGIDKNTFKQAIVKSFVWLANLTSTTLIAEGIETIPEARTLISLGVHAGQGYLLGRPEPALAGIPPEVRQEILEFNKASTAMHSYASKHIGEICDPVDAFDVGTQCMSIRSYFSRSATEGACIVENGHIVGLIMRNKLDAAMSAQYGYSLYASRPIGALMDSSCLIVDYYTPISTVSDLAMSRPHTSIYDNIIVTRNMKYAGIVSIIDLLKHSSEIEKSFALELNPLTGLPGNMQINNVLYNAIVKGEECCVLYVDLDNFKIYNDAYGFRQGDAVIQMTKEIICRNIKDRYTFSSFVGHIGGDDFLAVVNCNTNDCNQLCTDIIREFSEEVRGHLDEEDVANGCIYGRARGSKELVPFPLTSMSIAVLSGIMSGFETPDRLSYQLSKIKSVIKSQGGGNYMIERTLDC